MKLICNHDHCQATQKDFVSQIFITHLQPPRGHRPVVCSRGKAVPIPVEPDPLYGRDDVRGRPADSWQDAVRCSRLLASELPQVSVGVVGADKEKGTERVGRQSLRKERLARD